MPPAVGKRSEVTQRALVRLGAIDSKTFRPTPDAQDDALNATIDWYDRIRPLQKIHQAAGDDVTRRFVLHTTIGATWVKGTSEVSSLAIVTAPDTNAESIKDVALQDWQQTTAANGDDVLMLTVPVAAGTTLRILWNSPHTVHADDAALTTVPTKDADAFVSMFAAFLARWISRKASDISAASLGADQIDAEPIGERWKRRAAELEKSAIDRLAPSSESVGSAGASIDWDSQNETGGGRPWIGH